MTQFRSFVFPCNPKTMLIEHGYRTVAHFCIGDGEYIENLGALAGKITFKGVFGGNSTEEAAEQIDKFLSETKNECRGLLYLPFYGSAYCYLSSFAIDNSADGRIIPYTMVFLKDSSSWEH